MMKFYKVFSALLMVGILGLASGTAVAQDTGFAPGGKGFKQINFGLELQGLGIPVYAGMDFGVGKMITIGPRIVVDTKGDSYVTQSYNSSWNRVDHETKWRSTIVIPSFRGDYHFSGHIKGLPSELDLYGGLTLGFVINRYNAKVRVDGELASEQPESVTSTSTKLSAQLGARYYWSDSWGVQLEFNSVGSDAALGLSYRF
jgi:outer membrane immunogenic protein